jgi:predicted nucleic acid-binding protein
MSRIVSDSTTLIVLERIGRLDLLELFDEVLIPPAVAGECGLSSPEGLGIHVRKEGERELIGMLGLLLDPGESEAIALAKSAGLPLIIDEKKGRRIARQVGVRVTGFLGLLLYAVERRRLSGVEACALLDEAISAGMYVGEKTRTVFERRLVGMER